MSDLIGLFIKLLGSVDDSDTEDNSEMKIDYVL